ncbi:squalene/phytoene synthase family protein [Phaeovulum sp.]|uniref:squalene/phytoene synthase family protein n=1 Tax=Phaeovulum sp. TaxID=2934796 RepID=UPI0035670450
MNTTRPATSAEEVRLGDPDRFVATLAAPAAARVTLWPLYALNLQLARAPWASAEPLVAEMRLQWWCDSLDDLGAGKSPAHPLLRELAPLVARTPALIAPLAAMAEARRRECWREGFADAAELRSHIEATAGNLMWASALALGAPVAAEPVVRGFGFASGLANWLRAVPALNARGLPPLPDPDEAAISALAATGLAEIAAARRARKVLPRRAAPALFSGWLAPWVLARAQAEPACVAAGQLEPSEFRRRATLLRPVFSGRW